MGFASPSGVPVLGVPIEAGGQSLPGMHVYPGSPGSQGIHVGVLSGTQYPVGDVLMRGVVSPRCGDVLGPSKIPPGSSYPRPLLGTGV